MTISSNNSNILPLDILYGKLNNKSVSNSESNDVQKQITDIAFQKIFEMMLGNMVDDNTRALLSTAIAGQNSSDFNSSLNSIGQFNLNRVGLGKSILYQGNSFFESDESEIGRLSSIYESNGDPGTISDNTGDPGGKSYGIWQFSSAKGSLNSFINWLSNNNPEYYEKLSSAKINDGNAFGENFDKAWKGLAVYNKEAFTELQRNYVKHEFYDPVIQQLKSKYNFDTDSKSTALQSVLWSTVVQHGVSGTLGLLSKINLNEDDAKIINEIYNERQKVNIYFKSSSEDIKQSVYNRFSREKVEALKMLGNETTQL